MIRPPLDTKIAEMNGSGAFFFRRRTGRWYNQSNPDQLGRCFRVAFNPSDHAVMLDPGEDGMKNAGIRLVYSIAKEINYQHLLEQNVLTIRV